MSAVGTPSSGASLQVFLLLPAIDLSELALRVQSQGQASHCPLCNHSAAYPEPTALVKLIPKKGCRLTVCWVGQGAVC